MDEELNIHLSCGDCLELMQELSDKSIDMILCDLPYGSTHCRWDEVIPFDPLWEQYRRIIKDNGAIVLFSAQPFTSKLVMSAPDLFRYEWIWYKTQPTGFLNVKKMPLRVHENIEVFYKKPPVYHPQMTHGHIRKSAHKKAERANGMKIYGYQKDDTTYDSTDRYPIDILRCSIGDKTKLIHPTQKPVALLEYLIMTYTNAGDTVLDNCMGSGSTGVACIHTDRNFIGMEKDREIYNLAAEWLKSYI